MYKFIISLKKETLLFLNDKVGLVLMFGMPVLLVFIITIIQDSVYKIVDSNRITLLVANHDTGDLGNRLITRLDSSGMFTIQEDKTLEPAEIKKSISQKKALTAIYISADFSEKLQRKSQHLSEIILADFGLTDTAGKKQSEGEAPSIQFYHDPVLQENYCYSIINILHAHLSVIESTRMIENIYTEMGASSASPILKETIQKNQIKIERIIATAGSQRDIPSSTQHNVPAWTIFAMFFMVVSLGTNIVKERTSGSFLRIRTMPSSFALVLVSKQFIYTIIAFLQVLVIFSIGLFILPLINLPPLVIPENITGTAAVIFVCSFAAVSYALMIGTLARTEDQSNGFGAISIIIFAALGGVWVPTFIMPHYLQIVSLFSPLHWCIEGFYILFLQHGNWVDLSKPIFILLAFSLFCQLVAYFKIKFEKYI
ncbi:MAG: ABC transporter permease [Bacteroidia bacterium]|nr:ABC transporter permease [Bacteroidia bacterium]